MVMRRCPPKFHTRSALPRFWIHQPACLSRPFFCAQFDLLVWSTNASKAKKNTRGQLFEILDGERDRLRHPVC